MGAFDVSRMSETVQASECDLVYRLRTLEGDALLDEAADTIESLRQQLAECELEIERQRDAYAQYVRGLTDKLATVTKGRDELAALNARMLVEYEARMKGRDELVAALLAVKEQRIDGHLFPAVVDMNAWHTKVINALAKVGADTTGDV